MHNGGVADFPKIKRRLQSYLPDEVFNMVSGNTDSQWSFALFLSKVSPAYMKLNIAVCNTA